MKKWLKPLVSVLIIAATIGLFARYMIAHPAYAHELGQTKLITIIWLVGINTAMIVVLSAIYRTTLRLTGHDMPGRDNFLLTIYSSTANFFGPLQSGPGVRAVYLKKRLGVPLKTYTFATLIYYAMYAVISAFFLLVGTRPWWQTVLAVSAAAGFSFFVLKWFRSRQTRKGSATTLHISPRLLATLLICTALQLSLVAGRYYTELRAVQAPVSVGQAISYTGAANFALFVSVTPDGVGIRESFLLFSQRIHHVATKDIAMASLLDRASYIAFLGLLFIVALSVHAKQKFTVSTKRPTEDSNDIERKEKS